MMAACSPAASAAAGKSAKKHKIGVAGERQRRHGEGIAKKKKVANSIKA